MSEDTTRRRFLQQSATVAGAVLVSGSLSSILAAPPANALPAFDLNVAIDLLTLSDSQRSGLLLLIAEHVGAVAATGTTKDVENAISAIREKVGSEVKDLDALRRETRETLTEAVAIETAAADGDPRYV